MISLRSKYNLKPIWAFFIFLLIPGFFLGCGTTKEKKLEREGLTLIYRPKSQVGSEIEKMKLDHPIKISEDVFANHLYSLQYEELSLLGKKKYVISLKDVTEITQILTKALNRMTPGNILIFDLETPRGTTRGEIFATGDSINFRFDSIKGVEFSGTSFAGSGGSIWRLVPVKGQRYKVTKRILGSSTKENWIVANMILPQTSRRQARNQKLQNERSRASQPSPAPQTAPGAPSGGNDQELEKKLKFLKDLRDKNLIDDSEYENKRKELLDSFL
ncbi:MAG: hypothetical protein NPINA01_03800 [Nitrospinaceae bacterium]|nr:MAG: hypothetical protein NPINA01_03800 [Nitrospinaceae bacterium]